MDLVIPPLACHRFEDPHSMLHPCLHEHVGGIRGLVMATDDRRGLQLNHSLLLYFWIAG